MYRVSFPRLLDLALIVSAAAGSIGILMLSRWHGGLFVENGPVEIAQLALLFLAACLFVRAGYKLDEWAGLSATGLALLSVLFLTRETPRCSSDFYEFGPCFADGYKTGLYVVAGLTVVLLLFANPSVRRLRPGPESLRALIRFLPKLTPLVLPALLLLLGQFGEHVGWDILEETAELTAYVALTLLAFRAAQAGDWIAASRATEAECFDPPAQ